jgi:methylmalonyl-CoA mutase
MSESHKLNDFEAASQDAWLKLVERDLAGAPFDKKLVKRVAGLAVKPLYGADDLPAGTADELPGFAPFTRGAYALGAAEMGWDVRQEVASGAAEEGAQAALENLNGGAQSLTLRFDEAAGALSGQVLLPRGPARFDHAEDGIDARNLAQLSTLLAPIDLEKTPVSLRAGAAGFAYAAGLLAVAKQRGLRSSALAGSFGLDPLTTLARTGTLPCSLDAAYDQSAVLVRWAAREAPLLRTLHVDTSAYHEAAADAAYEIALALGTGVEYLRALSTRGVSVPDALAQLSFGFSVGRDFFLEIAKLRAARRAWAQVVSATGVSSEHGAMLIHASTSLRETTQRDPWVNMLRGTAESLAAVVGGADAITTHGFDAAYGASDEFAARMARNTQHLLRHEANVHRVVDPAGGSFYVEALTQALLERAWAAFQNIERAGGLTQALLAGSVQAQLAESLKQDEKAVETRKLAITGVNEFPNVGEAPIVRAKAKPASSAEKATLAAGALAQAGDLLAAASEALAQGASFIDVTCALSTGAPAQAKPLIRERLAAPLEALRDRADAQLASTGARPRVFLANLGPIAEHKARAAYAQNFFEAAGFQTSSNDGFQSADEAALAFTASGAALSVLCSSDSVYAELAESTAQALTRAGSRAVVLAGNPGEREALYRAAGVTDFIFVGTNLVTTLSTLLTRAGVK